MNISNDKKSFYQWETNRFLVDEDFKINQEVCFSSVKLRKALVVKTKLKNNKIVVEVPNLLLQDYHPIMVHWVIADENGKYVTKEQEFQVLKRAKPEDYVYTETEIFSFLDLEQRLKNLEEEGINKAIADYFVKNPIQSGATSEQAAQIIQNKENIEKLNKNKLDADKLPEAINNALAQAEASGAFKGEPGKDGVVPVTGAVVGQTVKITAVDENGNPTEWEATDFPESSTQADWNQNNPEDGGYIVNRTHYDYVAHILKTKEEINAIINSHGMPRVGEVLEDLTFRVVVDGTVYDNVPVCYTYYAGSDTWGIGDIYYSNSPNPWNTTNYGFCYSLYGPIHNSDVFPNGIQSIEIYTAEKKSKQLDPKYIKDMYYETPEVWTTLDIVDNGNKLITNYYWEINKPYKLRVDGVVYSFDSITKGAYHSASGFYTWYFGSEPLIANTIIVNNWNYPFTIYSTGYGSPKRETYVLFEDGAVDHTIEVFESETIVHTIAPKYIKDMYYEESVELFSVENAEFVNSGYMLETPFTIVDGHTYIVNWDGVEYTCEAYIFEGLPAIGNTAEFGGKGNGEPFVIGYNSYENVTFVNSFEDLATHTFSVVEIVCHTIAPKYIKDMYYEEVIKTDITGASYTIDGFDTSTLTVSHDPIPLKLGQVWEENHKHYSGNWTGSANYEVQQTDDGVLYLGAPIGTQNSVHFYLTTDELSISSTIINAGYSTFKFTCISGVTDESIIHQIDTKYLPIIGEDIGTVFEMDGITSNNEFADPLYKMLLGEYTVIVDSISETVEFVDDGGYSWAEGNFVYIETRDGGIYFEFPDDEPHSVKIIGTKQLIKEEYLSDSVLAQPDWNQNDPNGVGYIENRTHYDNINHYLIDGAFVNLDINQLYTVQIYDDIYENVPVYNAGTNNDPIWGVGDKRVVNYPFGFFKYPCWPSNDIINTELSMISFDRNIYPDATINDVQIYQRILKKLDEKYVPTATDDEIISMLTELDMFPVVTDSDGAILADESDNILLW